MKILKEINLYGFSDNMKSIQLSQYEHGESGIKCNLFNNRHEETPIDLSECLQANFYGSKADETTIGIECVAEDNTIVVPIRLQMTTCPGKVKGVLECVFDNGNIRFYGVNFEVRESPNTEQIESTDEFTVLEKSIAEVQELLKFADIKLDKPTENGTSGQVLTLSDDGTTKWSTPTGGGGSVDLNEYAKTSYVDEKIGDIEKALDELHTYAQSLITGGVSE